MKTIQSLCAAHRAWFAQGKTLSTAYRLEALKKLHKAITVHQSEILEALHQDLNKSEFEGYATEVGLVLEELRKTISHLKAWTKPKRVPTPILHFASRSFEVPEPFGTVLIMSPWNYPFQLAMIPLVGAVAAGNCCVLKPSEYSVHTAEIIEKLVRMSFAEDHVSVVRGGRAANHSLLDEKFDYIFFTGSPNVGHVVMEAAAKHLTPVTLELGGKSPCIVDETADLKIAARRIIWGKLLNAGQTCIAPDYLLVQESVKDRLLSELQTAIVRFYGEKPEENPSYPKIINDKHFLRLRGLLSSGKMICGGRVNEETRQISPTILDGVTLESPVMQEEIFGPIFPVLTFQTLEEVISLVNSRPKPLALYFFTTDKKREREILRRVSFGGGCINDTITHIANPNLPFGGVGNSGMGNYHGKRTFETFTHRKAVLKKANWIDVPLRYSPNAQYTGLIKKLMR